MIINENIYRLTIPYKDIFTTVYLIKTEEGLMLFDAASYDEDIKEYILPWFDKLGIEVNTIKYVFLSHFHKDHAGGLKELIKYVPNACIVTRKPELKEEYAGCNVFVPEDNDVFLKILRVVTIPGHTMDCCAVFDERTDTLITGDSLQLYGIYGSGNWGSNILFPKEHIEAINKLKKLAVKQVLTAHDYHPYGYNFVGENAVNGALNACLKPLNTIKDLINENPEMDDEQICKVYNESDKPTLGSHVVTAVRNMLKYS